MSALENFLAQFKTISDVIIDSYFVCDNERNIVDFNRAFFSLLPRNIARGLKGKKCYDVLALNICRDKCIAQQCWGEKKSVRLDENGNPVGALEIQRDVTDEAVVQVKYQEMLDTEAQERERLAGQIRSRTKELLDSNQTLLRVQKELLAYKKGLTI